VIDSLKLASARLGRRDLAIAIFFCGASLVYLAADRASDVAQPSLAAFPFFLLIMAPIAWRRVAPIAAAGASLAALLLNIAVFGEFARCGIVIPMLMVLVFSIGAQLPWRQGLIGLGLVLGSTLAICLWDGPDGAMPSSFPFVLPFVLAVFGAGCLLHSRARVTSELSARTAELRQARDRRARLEVAADRARVSAELDELLQRRLGDLAAIAEAGGRAENAPDATAALQEIEAESRRTLNQMRAVVGVLRDEGEGDGFEPQPTLSHLEALLLRTRGADARLTVEGNPRVLPAGVELSAYRIVEHLLDALQDVPVDVAVRFGDDALELTVAGPSRHPNAAAIRRAQERVQLHRGTLESTTSGGRARAVASLPMLAGA
jgi:signal transduction histidine kinase